MWDRFFDNYVMTPMQKVVLDECTAYGAALAGCLRESLIRVQRLCPVEGY